MKRTFNRIAHRLAAAAAVTLVAVTLVSCGGDEETQKLTFAVNTKGESTAVKAPKTAETGLAEITLKNNSGFAADLQLIRVEGKHDAKQVTKAMGKAIEGEPLPDWFFAGGGIGLTEPASSATVTKVLRPGTYYAFNTENAETTATMTVTGEPSEDDLPEHDAVLETGRNGEYSFTTPILPAGADQILFRNVGQQPHHIIATKLVGNNKRDDAERYFKTGNGEPLDEETLQSTAVLENGESQLVTFKLEPGRYALYCFISDRQGGGPHALKGMVTEVQVEKADDEAEDDAG